VSDDPTEPQRKGKQQHIRLKPVIDEDVAAGTYSNLATIIAGPGEFFIDFGRVVPGRSEFKVFSRIILSPAHAKQFARALADNVRHYEQAHGDIPGLPESVARRGGEFH